MRFQIYHNNKQLVDQFFSFNSGFEELKQILNVIVHPEDAPLYLNISWATKILEHLLSV